MLNAKMKTKAVWRQYALHLYGLANNISYCQESNASIKSKSHLDSYALLAKHKQLLNFSMVHQKLLPTRCS